MPERSPLRKTQYLVITKDFLIPVFIILAVIGVVFFTLKSSLFAISDISCQEDNMPCSNPSLMAELNRLKGINLLTFDSSSIAHKLTSGDFTISSISFQKKLPHSLIVTIKSVSAAVALQSSAEPSKWITLDSKGRVVAVVTQDPHLPVIELSSPLNFSVGQEVPDSNIAAAVKFAIALGPDNSLGSKISVDGDTVTIYLSSGRIALLSMSKDWSVQIQTLQAILTDSTMTKDKQIIDVRFARPVLK